MDAKTQLDQAIAKYVRPDSFPLAVRMVEPGESLPERTKRPHQEFGHPVAVCHTFSIARRYGWQMAVGVEDINCPQALTAFGFKPEVNTFSCGEMCAGMFTESKEAGERTEPQYPKHYYRLFDEWGDKRFVSGCEPAVGQLWPAIDG